MTGINKGGDCGCSGKSADKSISDKSSSVASKSPNLDKKGTEKLDTSYKGQQQSGRQ